MNGHLPRIMSIMSTFEGDITVAIRWIVRWGSVEDTMRLANTL
jgi:hypothetical protein